MSAMAQNGTTSLQRWLLPPFPHTHERLSRYEGTDETETAMMFDTTAVRPTHA